MSKQKTALQQAIDLFKSELEEKNKSEFDERFDLGLQYAINRLYLLLPTEREQIQEAFNQGMINSVDYFTPNTTVKESDNYFTETYENND